MKDQIRSQYHASLEMLQKAIVQCPEDLWTLKGHGNEFWHLAYHTLYFTDLYLAQDLDSFQEWEKHRKDYMAMGPIPHEDNRLPDIQEPYTKEEVMEYFHQVVKKVNMTIEQTDMAAPSGFFWLPFDKLELQFYNIRHIHHHTGQLLAKLKEHTGSSVGWVRHAPQA